MLGVCRCVRDARATALQQCPRNAAAPDCASAQRFTHAQAGQCAHSSGGAWQEDMLACRFRMTMPLTFLGMRTSSSWVLPCRLTCSPHDMHSCCRCRHSPCCEGSHTADADGRAIMITALQQRAIATATDRPAVIPSRGWAGLMSSTLRRSHSTRTYSAVVSLSSTLGGKQLQLGEDCSILPAGADVRPGMPAPKCALSVHNLISEPTHQDWLVKRPRAAQGFVSRSWWKPCAAAASAPMLM